MNSLFRLVQVVDRCLEIVVCDVLFNRRWRGKAMALTAGLGLAFAFAPSRPAAPIVTAGHGLTNRDLMNRPWIDRLPQGPRDAFSLYFFTDEDMGPGNIGVHLNGIPVRFTTELFAYAADSKRVKFLWLAQDGQHQSDIKVTYEDNGRYDMKLVVQKDPRHDGKTWTYYGREDGDLGVAELDAAIHSIRARKQPARQ
jgi:hypothetical protein